MRILIKTIFNGLICFLFLASLSGNPSDPMRFEVKRNGLETRISSEGLNLINHFLKPNTIPETADPSGWKLISETSADKHLGGVSGHLTTVSYFTNTSQLDCQTWISANNDLVAFRQIFTNKSKKPVKLNKLNPLQIDGKEEFSFGSVSDWRILEEFRQKNDLPVSVIPEAGKTVSCDPFFIINNDNGKGKNLFIGYQTFYYHLAEISISFDSKLQLNNITSECDFEGIDVPVNGIRSSQWVIIAQGEDANSLIKDYTGRVRAFYDMKEPLKNAPSVYCSWYYHADNYREDLFLGDIARFKREHMPFDVFLIDECWDMMDWGDFESNSSFPGGMKRAADQILSAGYIPGIWTAPFLVDAGSDLARNHPEWLLRNSKGINCTFNMNNLDHFILDLTYPGVCEYLEEQFRKISRDWGYNYFKFDFMRSVFIESDQQFYDKTATSIEAYRKGLEAIRRGTGSDAYISVCGGHYGASLGIANTQRSGSDVKSQWAKNELPKYRQNILRTWMAGLWHVDPDAMMVRRQEKPNPDDKRNISIGLFTDDEAFTNTLNQFIGGNLITFTEDFSKIDKDREMLYKHVIPSPNSSSVPLDIFNINCPELMLTHITPVCEKLSDWNMLSIVNWSDDAKDYNIRFDSKLTAGLSGEIFLIYDFQSGKIVSQLSHSGILNIKGVKPHQGRLLKIVPWEGKPMFIGTDLNFSCGGIEIAEINYANDNIRGLLKTDWFVPVRLTFVLPDSTGYEIRQIETSPGQKRFALRF
jgi:hypothetical protein